MSFLNYLNEKSELASANLEEAINTFADLPAKWKKILSSRTGAGKDSAVTTTKFAAKNEASFNKAVTEAFKTSTESSYVVISVEDQPFALLYNSNSEYDPEKINFITVDGSRLSINKYVNGSRHNNYKGYYQPKTNFKITEAKEKLKGEIREFGKTVLEDGESLSYDELVKRLNIDITVVKADEVRYGIKKEREANKTFDDDLTANKKKAIRNFMVDVVENIIEDIKNSSIKLKDANTILDDILEGKTVDFNIVKDNQDIVFDKFRHLSRILHAFKDAHSSGKIMDSNYWDEKGKAGMDIKYLLKIIKEYEDTYNSK